MQGPGEQVRRGLGSASTPHPAGHPSHGMIPAQALEWAGGVGVLSASGDGRLRESLDLLLARVKQPFVPS